MCLTLKLMLLLYHVTSIIKFLIQHTKNPWHSYIRDQQGHHRSASVVSHHVKEASTHHILLCGVFMALENPDPMLIAHALNLFHRLVSKFLQGNKEACTHRIPFIYTGHKKQPWKPPSSPSPQQASTGRVEMGQGPVTS